MRRRLGAVFLDVAASTKRFESIDVEGVLRGIEIQGHDMMHF